MGSALVLALAAGHPPSLPAELRGGREPWGVRAASTGGDAAASVPAAGEGSVARSSAVLGSSGAEAGLSSCGAAPALDGALGRGLRGALVRGLSEPPRISWKGFGLFTFGAASWRRLASAAAGAGAGAAVAAGAAGRREKRAWSVFMGPRAAGQVPGDRGRIRSDRRRPAAAAGRCAAGSRAPCGRAPEPCLCRRRGCSAKGRKIKLARGRRPRPVARGRSASVRAVPLVHQYCRWYPQGIEVWDRGRRKLFRVSFSPSPVTNFCEAFLGRALGRTAGGRRHRRAFHRTRRP